jgi:O-antigen ligase
MAARIDWARWFWPVAMACVAAPVGLLAGLNPAFAIVAALAFVLLLVVMADLANGVVLFTFIIYFEQIPGLTGGALSLTKVAGLLLAVAWLATLATRPDAKTDLLRQHPWLGAVLVLFLAWAGLSFAWAENPASAFEAFYRLALNGILFMIVYTAIRTPRDAIRVFAAFVIGAVAAMGIALASGTEPTPYGEAARISGEFANANTLASTLVAALALSMGLAIAARRSPALRFAALFAAFFALFGVMLTVSRAGLVALGVAALAAIIFSGRWRTKATVLSITVSLGAVVYFAALAPPEARERVSTADGGTGRQDIWKVAWRMAEDNPVRGVGAGNFSTSSIHYLIAPGLLRRSDFIVDTQKVAHNVYLETLAELGIVGLSLLVVLILLVVRCSYAAVRQFERNGDVAMEIIARAQLVAMIGFLASLFFSSDHYSKQLWLLFSTSPMLLAIARSQQPDDEQR